METSFALLLTYLIFFLIVFLISVFITRWIFGIPKIIRHLKSQSANLEVLNRVISKMAEQQGVSSNEISNIKDVVRIEMNK